MKLVNAFCRLVEVAAEQGIDPTPIEAPTPA